MSLGKFGIDHRKRQRVEGQIPGGKPGIFPLVRHGEYLACIKMLPVMVPPKFSACRRRRISWITFQPGPDVETVTLFTPDHSRESLALDQPKILIRHLLRYTGVKFV